MRCMEQLHSAREAREHIDLCKMVSHKCVRCSIEGSPEDIEKHDCWDRIQSKTNSLKESLTVKELKIDNLTAELAKSQSLHRRD